MGLSTSTTIFLFIVCLCGGVIIGGLLSRVKKTATAEPVESVEQEPSVVEPVPAPEPVLPPAPKSLAGPDDVEVLHAWRDVNGKVWIEMDETRFESKDAMNPEQRRKLVNLVLELRPWLDASQVPAAAPRPVVKEKTQPARQEPRPSLFAPIPIKTDKSAAAEDEKKPKVNLKTIVQQIDDVLQEKLSTTVFKDQEIHLLDGPAGTVLVQIGDDSYEGIDAAPDPELRALIRQAITDWEKGSS